MFEWQILVVLLLLTGMSLCCGSMAELRSVQLARMQQKFLIPSVNRPAEGLKG
jgi:hypothetical protein